MIFLNLNNQMCSAKKANYIFETKQAQNEISIASPPPLAHLITKYNQEVYTRETLTCHNYQQQ